MSEFDHWMRFNIGDYLADTMHLTTFQHGVYIRLLMHCFKHGGEISPADDTTLARIAGVHPPHWKRYCLPVKALFYEGGSKVVQTLPLNASQRSLKHKRIDAELSHAREVTEARRKAGLRGAQVRHGLANAKNQADREDGNCQQARGGARATPELDPHPNPKEASPVGPAERGRADAVLNNGGGRKRIDGTNPRAEGTNPRANGTDLRSNSANPRANGSNPRASRNSFTDIVTEQLDAEAADPRRESATVVVLPRRSDGG